MFLKGKPMSTSVELSAALRARQTDTLGGALEELDRVEAHAVDVIISGKSAITKTGQHLALHLVNLLGRLEGVVASVSPSVEAGPDPALLRGVDPRRPRGGGSLVDALLAAASLAAPHRGGVTRDPAGSAGPPLRIWVGGDPSG